MPIESGAQGEKPATDTRFFGKFRGVVKRNTDPLGRGRLQVLVPQVMEDSPAWAMPCVPYAGKDRGFFALPDEGTGVWVGLGRVRSGRSVIPDLDGLLLEQRRHS
jgi:hypothetical protein